MVEGDLPDELPENWARWLRHWRDHEQRLHGNGADGDGEGVVLDAMAVDPSDGRLWMIDHSNTGSVLATNRSTGEPAVFLGLRLQLRRPDSRDDTREEFLVVPEEEYLALLFGLAHGAVDKQVAHMAFATLTKQLAERARDEPPPPKE